ncbi:hypothetical protein SAMN05720470_10247 [Fibrobacter sp. UWOV1]|uniref:hypothetical protein n=1 Tax=Fibrobacter sp. UWOV1 TaxID=1896215 RepID=UPI00091515F2|nr:hypothetical protein [Fibrobacter sp. UWOV1]SHK67610.1 hypothetical protein SAMN05720470_10247 [Fibrobacter sp. UWOV1]
MKILALVSLIVSTIAFAAPQYPFPQNKQYAYGHIFNPDLKKTETAIRQKFDDWRKKWVTENVMVDGVPTAYIKMSDSKIFRISSKDIAYGMLVSVYMADASNDAQSLFNQFMNFYRCFALENKEPKTCKSQNFKIMAGEVSENDSSLVRFMGVSNPIADMGAALALLLADKQWGSEGAEKYATYAETLLQDIYNNDVDASEKTHIKAYSDYDPAFNPSYSAFANFKIFAESGAALKDAWNTLAKNTAAELVLCQDSATGLVPLWCDYSTHKPVKVMDDYSYEEDPGFNYDALLVPWRMATAYYWYGDENAKKVNDKLAKWLSSASYGHASYIKTYYKLDGSNSIYGKKDVAEASGVGLAFSSTDKYDPYLETVYESLMNLNSKTARTETERILELLLLTGNMPDLTHMENTKNIVTASVMRQPQMPKGTQDSTLKVSGFGNWVTKSNGFNKITIFPDSTKKPLFADNGKAFVKAEMRAESSVGKDCTGADCYVFSGLALYLDDKYQDLSDVDTIRMTLKTQGVIEVSALCYGKNEDGLGIPCWKGGPINPSENFTTLSFWIDNHEIEKETMGKVKGFAFEPMMTPGGYASIEIQDIKFLTQDGKLAKLYNVLGIDTTQQPVILATLKTSKPAIHVAGRTISIQNSMVAKTQLFDMQGRLLLEKTIRPNDFINVPCSGSYILRLNNQVIPIKVHE